MKQTLKNGISIRSLDSGLVNCAVALSASEPRLSTNDCFALTLAMSLDDCILLTADGALRRRAARQGVEVHGVLWLLDCMLDASLVARATALEVLEAWHDDPTVHLPPEEIQRAIQRIKHRPR
jgi:predicted nucleic acid-binding protein